MKRILVTGGAGFIGSHTVDLLLKNNYKVIVIDNLSTGKLSYLNLFDPNLEFIQRDILDYPKLLAELSRCDAVLHLAAIVSIPLTLEDPIRSLQVNTQGFLYLLQAIREIKKPIRFVYASSAAIYGNIAKLPCDDELVMHYPIQSPYALEKTNNELYAELYDRLYDIKSLGLRYFNVYGLRQDPKSPYSGVISKFIASYSKHEPLIVFGDGKQSRDFISVEDVARANLLALECDYTGILNIGTGKAEHLINLISYIEKAGSRKAEIDFRSPRIGDVLHSYAKISKAEQLLGFRASVSLEKGIECLVNT